MRPALAAAATAALALLTAPRPARAFCQTYTCEFDGRDYCSIDPVTGCASGGLVARWPSACITYAVQTEGSAAQSISAETLRQVVEDGFAAWSDAVCVGRGPGVMTPAFTASYRGTTSCDAVEFNCGAERNDNIVMFRDGESELSANTIALSSIITNLSTGDILDVDIEINSRDFELSTDAAAISAGAHDLRLVINHELGHLLGLSHSRDEGSLMNADYAGASRLPGRDDARGMCNIFAVSAADPECSVPPIEGGGSCVGTLGACQISAPERSCSLGLPGASAAGPSAGGALGALGGLLALVGAGRLRRRRAGRPRRSSRAL